MLLGTTVHCNKRVGFISMYIGNLALVTWKDSPDWERPEEDWVDLRDLKRAIGPVDANGKF